MLRYLELFLRTFKHNMMEALAHRVNFVLWIFIHLLNTLLDVVFFGIIYQNIPEIHGWNFYQVIVLLGMLKCITSLGSLSFFSIMYDFSQSIRRGDFDIKLIKPVSPLFTAAFSWVDVEDATNLLNGMALVGIGLVKLRPEHLLINIFSGVVMTFFSLLFLFAILVLIESLAFKFVNVSAAQSFFWSFFNLGTYPIKAMSSLPVVIWSLLIPIALITSVPAEVVFGRFDWPWIVGSIVASIVLFFISKSFFYAQLKAYSSASS